MVISSESEDNLSFEKERGHHKEKQYRGTNDTNDVYYGKKNL